MALDRPAPPYVQIADRYRREIIDGTREAGARLPTIAEIAKEYNVATATAAKAITQLQVEGLVYSSPQGTFVVDTRSASAPHDRLRRVRTTGRAEGTAESVRIISAGIVRPPRYVSELLATGDEEVVRREWVTLNRSKAAMLSVSWFSPHAIRDLLTELVSDDPTSVQMIEQAVARRLSTARDYYEARECDDREARHLGIRIGAPVLAGTYLWHDRDGAVIEYGEYVIPPGKVITYEYEVSS
jgi:GntR family transcriptional regulator